MSGAWGEDPWRRHAYRWYDERGWTEHVSDGVNEGLDQPGDRQTFAAPSAPVAPSGPVWIETAETVRAEPVPVVQVASTGSSTPPRRWPLAVLGMVASFALGGWIFSGGDDDDQPVGVSAVEDVVDSTVMGVDVPVGVDTPAVVLPTTTALVEPVPASVPPPVTLPVDPAASPVTIGTVPLPVSDAERAARNDGAIDPFEKAIIDEITAGLDMPTTTNEELLAVGTTLCQAAAASPTQADLEAAILGPLTSSGMSPLRWGFLAGGAGGVMCLDEFVRLGIVPAA